MNTPVPAEVFHPGVFIEEELEERGWSQTDFAEIIGRDNRTVSEILSGKRGITAEMALTLADALGTSAQLWLNLEAAFQLSKIQNRPNTVAQRAKLYEKFPVREIIRRGWIQFSDDIEVLKSRFCDFYGISDLDEVPSVGFVARKENSVARATNPSQTAWLFRVRQLAAATVVSNPFSKDLLKACIQKLKLLLRDPEEIRHVPPLLADVGIRFVVVEAMPKSRIDGATLWLDENSPVVALSLRIDQIDRFWFTLFHELSHVANGEGKDEPCLDEDLCGESVETDNKPDFEVRADYDAASSLVSPDALTDFINSVTPNYLEAKIRSFAEAQKIHPGIVVGQLHGREIPYLQHRKMLVKIRSTLLGVAPTDGFGYTPIV